MKPIHWALFVLGAIAMAAWFAVMRATSRAFREGLAELGARE